MNERPVLVFVEHVLWSPGGDWDEALAALAARFARSAPLDPDAIRARGPLHAQLEQLDAWAQEAGANLDRELGRWFDEHLAMHVRPAPSITRAVRAMAADRPLHAASALPARAAESITRHAGCWRSVAELHSEVRSAEQLATLVASLDAQQVIAAEPTPLPDALDATSLLQPTD